MTIVLVVVVLAVFTMIIRRTTKLYNQPDVQKMPETKRKRYVRWVQIMQIAVMLFLLSTIILKHVTNPWVAGIPGVFMGIFILAIIQYYRLTPKGQKASRE